MHQLKSMAFLKFVHERQRRDSAVEWLTAKPFAHRGLHGQDTGLVENSMSAFKAAAAKGYGIELDVQCSRDGVAMVFHDLTLDRLTDASGRVDQLTARELQKIKLKNSHDTLLPLRDVLDELGPDIPVLVEVKGERDTRGILELSVAGCVVDRPARTAVMSFWPASLGWFSRHTPHLTRGLVATSRYAADLGLTICRTNNQRLVTTLFEPDFIAYDIKALPNGFTTWARGQGLPVLTWTVRTKSDHDRTETYADNIIFEEQRAIV